MGNGLSVRVATTTLSSLNVTFGAANMPTMKLKYGMLNTLYPNLLLYTSDTSDRHVWRRRTLRHAGWLLTSEVNFNAHAYPAKNYIKWLKWLTWLQMMPPTNATVTVNGVVTSGVAPAQAIMSTLKAALEDGSQGGGIQFLWNEGAALAVSVNQVSGNYSISVTSAKESDINNVGDDDEDGTI